jgi:hypothetical protein
MNEKKEIKRKENELERTNPNPNPNFPHSDKPEMNNSTERKGKGARVRVRRMNLHRRGRRRNRVEGAGSPGSAKEAPRPGRSTMACSPVGEHARRRGGRRRRKGPLARRFSLSVVARCCRWREKRESGEEEREREGTNG